MERQQATGMDIKNKKPTAPTPQNTPSNPATIPSNYQSTIPTISEDQMESDGTGNSAFTGAFANNPAVLSMLQGKLGTLVGRSSGYIESLPVAVKRRIDSLKYYQSENELLEAQFQEEMFNLEKKYHELYRPLYEKRAEVIAGTYEPTSEEVEKGAKVDAEDDEDEEEKQEGDEQNEQDDDIAGIPEFWLTALKNHPHMAERIMEKDEDLLKKLKDIRLSYVDQKDAEGNPQHGFRIEFEFDANDYLKENILTKTYYYQEQTSGGDYMYDRAEGCEIQWKDGKDLTKTTKTKKQRNKSTNKTRVVKRTVDDDSFFLFFSPPVVPEDEEDLDEEEAERLDELLEADYEAGEEFKDKIIRHAVDFFTGKALEYGDFDEEDDFEDNSFGEEDDEDEDEDEDDDEDDDDGDDNARTGKGENTPECKQQ